MKRKLKKQTTTTLIIINGYPVLYCHINPFSSVHVTYNGRLFRCGCPSCGRYFKNKNLYRALDAWNDYVESMRRREKKRERNEGQDHA